MGQCPTLKQSHEWGRKGRQPLKVCLQSAFATDGVAKQERQKVQDLILAEPPAHEAHLRRQGLEQSVRAQVLSNEQRFRVPRGYYGLGRRGGLYLQTGMGYGEHGSLQRDMV